MAVVTVAFEDLYSWLQAQPDNTPDTPYELNVTNLTIYRVTGRYAQASPLGNIFKTSSVANKYVDLSSTVFPEGLTDMSYTFYDCETLVSAPAIPNTVTSLYWCFYYCVKLKRSPVLPNGVTNIGGCFLNCNALQQAPVIPNTVTRMDSCFGTCFNLHKAPIIPNSVTNMSNCFARCSSLQYPPIIPNSVTNLDDCFFMCSDLEYKPIIPSSVTSSTNCYEYVLTTKLGDSAERLATWIPAQTSEFEVCKIVADADNNCYEITGTVYGVDVSNLDTWLSEHDANTVDTPYEIKVLNYTPSADDGRPLRTALYNHPNRFVDLSYTTFSSYTGTDAFVAFFYNYETPCVSLVKSCQLPSGITALNVAFSQCTNLKEAPTIPNSVTDMTSTFAGCTSLTETPTFESGGSNTLHLTSTFKDCTSLQSAELPDRVDTLESCFKGCVSLVSIPSLPISGNDVTYTFENCTSLKDAPAIPSGVTYLYYTFNGCTSLVNAPTLPNTITGINYAFKNCTSLEKPPVLPSGLLYMNYAFQDCTNLAYVPDIPNTVTNMNYAFSGCSKIHHEFNSKTVAGVSIYHSTHIDMRTAPTIGAMNKDYGSNVENSVTGNDFAHNEYSGCDLSDNVTVSQTIDTLDSDGKKSRIYIVKRSSDDKIVVLAQQNYYAPAVKFWDADDITVNSNGNLSVPQGTYWNEHDSGGFYTDSTKTTLINTDYFSASSDGMYDRDFFNIGDTFYFESESYENYNGTYEVLVNDAVFKTTLGIDYTDGHNIIIPASVTNATECFKGCTALEEIAEFLIPLNTLKNNANFQNMFQNCTSLRQIGHKVATEPHWHVMSLNIGASSVSGKVYDSEGNATTIPSTSVIKTNLVMSNITDEILFPPVALSDSDLEDVILNVLANKYTWWKREAIDPTQKTFVLYADDPENVITNIAGGTNIKVYDTQAQAEADLANLSEGQIIATEMGGDGAVDEVTLGDTRVVTSNAVAKAMSYSSEEQFTGEYWLDGKKVYKRTWYSATNWADETVIGNISFDTIISIKNISRYSTGGYYENYGEHTGLYSMARVMLNGNVVVQRAGGFANNDPSVVIVKYTKTTD